MLTAKNVYFYIQHCYIVMSIVLKLWKGFNCFFIEKNFDWGDLFWFSVVFVLGAVEVNFTEFSDAEMTAVGAAYGYHEADIAVMADDRFMEWLFDKRKSDVDWIVLCQCKFFMPPPM